MKRVLLFSLFVCFLSVTLNAQKVVQEVKLSNGKMIVILDDNTWMEKEEYIEESKKLSQKNEEIHEDENESDPKKKYGYCGAWKKKGGVCKRRVLGGGKCWQHGAGSE